MSDEHFTDLIRRVREFIRTHDGVTGPCAERAPAMFANLARDIFAAQFEAVPPYQALCRARGITPATLGDWRDIPAVPTSAFKEFDFTSLAPPERTGVFHSSGTTGQARSRHFHDAESLALYAESVRAWFEPHVLSEATHRPMGEGRGEGRIRGSGWHFLILAPPAAAAPHSSLAYMFTHVADRWGGSDPAFLADVDAAGSHV